MILPKKKSVTFYVLHLPILLLIAAVFTLTTYVSSKVASNKLVETDDAKGSVLSSGNGVDEDEDEDDDDGGDNDEDEGDDEDDNSGSDDDEDKDEDEIEDEDEGDDDNSGSGRSGETKSETKVVNDDGTFSIVKTEEKDGEVEKEIKTFDASGNKILVEKYEIKKGESETRIAAYDSAGNKISDVRLKTEDGKKLELRIKEGETELSRVRFDVRKQELIIKSEDSVFEDAREGDDTNRLKIRLVGNDFLLTRKGIDALSKFPLAVDDATGSVFVKTPVGEIELRAMPDTIVEKAEASDDIDDITAVSLESESSPLEFKLIGTKSEKLLGVFNLQIPSTVIYDAQTGERLKSEQSFVTKVLDLFSF